LRRRLLFRRRLRFTLGFTLLGWRRIARFLVCRTFVTFTAVVGYVKSAPLEDQPRAAPQHPPHLALAPLFHLALLLRTSRKGIVAHGLKTLKRLPAFRALVLVSRH